MKRKKRRSTAGPAQPQVVGQLDAASIEQHISQIANEVSVHDHLLFPHRDSTTSNAGGGTPVDLDQSTSTDYRGNPLDIKRGTHGRMG